jgi:hypothetical protein
MKRPAAAALGALWIAAAGARAQSNQGGGIQLNPDTSANTIANGGGTGQAIPINKIVVPVTPAGGEEAPASNEKDHPLHHPLSVPREPRKKKLSDKKLVKKIHGEIIHDLDLPDESKSITVTSSAGRVTLTGTVLTEDNKYRIAAMAALLVGVDNVVNLIEVKPAAPAP